MIDSKSIKNWSEDERPREKMLQKGAMALTDAELLAILISSGTKEKSALDLGREILEIAHNNLLDLGRLSIAELKKVKGIGEARAITICAALEIGRRRQIQEAVDRAVITTSKDAANILMPLLQDLNHEAFYVVYLNQSNRFIRAEKVSDGGMTATIADIRIILKNALLFNSNQIILSHNHPSGNLKPSESDRLLTLKVRDAAKIMDIKLIDHIIIAGSNYVSLADEGIL